MSRHSTERGLGPAGIRKAGRQALPKALDHLLQHLAEELAREYVRLMTQPEAGTPAGDSEVEREEE